MKDGRGLFLVGIEKGERRIGVLGDGERLGEDCSQLDGRG